MDEEMKKKLMGFFQSPLELKNFLKLPYEDIIVYHYSFGMWIRNNIVLPNSKVVESCREISITPDDLSYILMINFYYQLNNTNIFKI